jgi:hypothetical protein
MEDDKSYDEKRKIITNNYNNCLKPCKSNHVCGNNCKKEKNKAIQVLEAKGVSDFKARVAAAKLQKQQEEPSLGGKTKRRSKKSKKSKKKRRTRRKGKKSRKSRK